MKSGYQSPPRLAVILLLLGGCTDAVSNYGSVPSGPGPTGEQIAQWQAAAETGRKQAEQAKKAEDNALCLEFGYKPGTKDYANCRENLHQKRQEAEQAALARYAAAQQAAAANQAAIAGAIIAKGPPQVKPIYVPQFPQQTYQPVPSVKLPQPVTTTCRQDPVLKGNVTCTSQ